MATPHAGTVFECRIVSCQPGSGSLTLEIKGDGAWKLFKHEPGGHRWQRIPPTEKRGRVHTSTVTVAVLRHCDSSVPEIDPNDVDIQTTRGSGPGGQHRNKTDSCVLAVHRPTGITARVDGRSQSANRKEAMEVLRSRVASAKARRESEKIDASRKKQKGSGMRGDKVRTYRSRDDQVTDHRTGRKQKLSQWIKGDWQVNR